jgi:RNA polymerase sigma-70 factor (ECF subfamily)
VVKAALNRARTRLRALAEAPEALTPRLVADERDRLRAYADRFNARDFDALRALLAEDVRLDLANRRRLVGSKDVSRYFTRYSDISGWRMTICRAEGRPALMISDPTAEATNYVVVLDWTNGRISTIRDYRFAPYVMESLTISSL